MSLRLFASQGTKPIDTSDAKEHTDASSSPPPPESENKSENKEEQKEQSSGTNQQDAWSRLKDTVLTRRFLYTILCIVGAGLAVENKELVMGPLRNFMFRQATAAPHAARSSNNYSVTDPRFWSKESLDDILAFAKDDWVAFWRAIATSLFPMYGSMFNPHYAYESPYLWPMLLSILEDDSDPVRQKELLNIIVALPLGQFAETLVTCDRGCARELVRWQQPLTDYLLKNLDSSVPELRMLSLAGLYQVGFTLPDMTEYLTKRETILKLASIVTSTINKEPEIAQQAFQAVLPLMSKLSPAFLSELGPVTPSQAEGLRIMFNQVAEQLSETALSVKTDAARETAKKAWRLVSVLNRGARDASPLAHLGRLEEESGNIALAKAAYERAVSISPGILDAAWPLAKLLLQEADEKRKAGDKAAAHNLRVRAKTQLDAAVEHLDAIAKQNPNFEILTIFAPTSELFATLVKTNMDLNLKDHVAARLRDWLAKTPTEPRVHIWRGKLAVMDKDWPRAVAAYVSAHRYQPSVELDMTIAKMQERAGNLKEAAQWANEALQCATAMAQEETERKLRHRHRKTITPDSAPKELQPWMYHAYRLLAAAAEHEKNIPDAVQHLEAAFSALPPTDPRRARVLAKLGDLAYRTEKPSDAVKQWLAAAQEWKRVCTVGPTGAPVTQPQEACRRWFEAHKAHRAQLAQVLTVVKQAKPLVEAKNASSEAEALVNAYKEILPL